MHSAAELASDALLARYRIACRFTQRVDRDRIRNAIRRWADGVDIPQSVAIRFAESKEEANHVALPYRVSDSGLSGRTRIALNVWPNSVDQGPLQEFIRTRDVVAMRGWEESEDAELLLELSRSAGAAAWRGWDVWNEWTIRSRSNTSPYVYDRRDVGWAMCTPATTLIDAMANGDEATAQKWLPLLEALEHGCFCMWRVHDIIWAAVLPSRVVADKSGQLHCSDGPAFEWLGDIRDFYWHGIRVPPYVVQSPEQITVATIEAERNAEVRRVMIERYRSGEEINGAAAFVRDAGGERIDHDERFGTLWRRIIEYGESILILEVVNATPEKDGRFKHYFLRVPPAVSTAREATAWTFGLAPQDYAPSVAT
jgi:hypothetical protein